MRITVPLVVHRASDDKSAGQHTVSALFRPQLAQSHRSLSSATSFLAKKIREELRKLAAEGKQEHVWSLAWNPKPKIHRLKTRIELKRSMFDVILPIVTLRLNQQRFGFCPLIEGLWFDVERKEDLARRTTTVVAHVLRECAAEKADTSWIEFFKAPRKYWLTSIDVDVSMSTPIRKQVAESELTELFGRPKTMHGDTELYRVGRCLEEMYPDGLHRGFHCEHVIERLERWHEGENRRPLLLVGEPLSGKTAVIHEWIHRRTSVRLGAYGGKRRTYLISPQRLISGMSYVGQWEERWNKILQTCQQRQHVVYFDDLLGLFAAGKSASSSLSAAHILKPYVESRSLSVLGEMTPAELRVFREQDRGFADLFEVIRIEERSVDETLKVLISLLGELESRHACQFQPEVLSSLLKMTRQFSVHGVLPGNAASVMHHLGAKHEKQEINREHLLRYFQSRTGLGESLVDSRKKLSRHDVKQFFGEYLIGQPHAVDAMLDVVSISKAQLGSGKRPLATLLFAGPTGVGKTEAAKTLARFLFGDADRILRFDLNEFVVPGSAQRLIGTFNEPDGLLTRAVRQQPFNVLLLDEVEKAHPEVFDLLLQVLGEGRLTDARGRTVDFTKSIIIMTSNIGAKKGAGAIGFVDNEVSSQQRFLSAVRAFWRPEFFNRLDRVIPFRQLDRHDLTKIADLLVTRFLARDGFHRRPCTVIGDQAVLDWVIERGFNDRLGGRALRRAVEQELVGPVGRRLAALPIEERSIVRVVREEDRLVTHVIRLSERPRLVAPRPPLEKIGPDFFAAVNDYLNGLLDRCDQLKGAAAFDSSHPLAFERIATRDHLVKLQARTRALASYSEQQNQSQSPRGNIQSQRPVPKLKFGRLTAPLRSPDRLHHKEQHAYQDINDYLADASSENTEMGYSDFRVEVNDQKTALAALLDDVVQLPLVVPDEQWEFQRVVVLLRALNQDGKGALRRCCKWLCLSGGSQNDAGITWESRDFLERYEDTETDTSAQTHSGTLRVTPLETISAWRKSQLANQRFPSSQRHASASQPDWVISDQLLGQHLAGILFEGHNALSWLKPFEGTLIDHQDDAFAPIQMIALLLDDETAVETAIVDVLDRHRRYDEPTMSNPQDPFRIQEIVVADLQAASSGSALLAKQTPLPQVIVSAQEEVS